MPSYKKHIALQDEDDEVEHSTGTLNSSREIYTPPEEFPLFLICVLFFASVTGALPLTSLFPYVANMVVHLGAAPDVDRAGFVSGYVASSFMFGRLLSSFYWGHVADSIGRKPVIYLSCVAIAVFSILFGFSVNIWMALISRFFLGFLNPLNSLTKTIISEICSKKHQPMGMAVAAGSWSVGLVIGPSLGGSLARSAQLYPGTVMDNPMTRHFPYLLPNALTALFAIFSLALLHFFLPETMAPKQNRPSTVQTGDSTATEGKAPSLVDADVAEETAFAAIARNASELMRDQKVRSACLAYFSISLSAIIYDECLPLWALSSKEKGGLGMNSAMIGTVTSITGIPMLVFTFIVFPYVSKKFGDVACFRHAQLICNVFALLTVVMSAVGALVGDAQIPVLVLMASGEKSFACIAFTANFLLINDSVSAERRASVNGFAMTVGGLAKTLGPIMGATLYAWSINNGVHVPPFNFVFVFLCCFLISIMTMFMRFETSSEADEVVVISPMDPVISALHDGSKPREKSDSIINNDEEKIRVITMLKRFCTYFRLENNRKRCYRGVEDADAINGMDFDGAESGIGLSPFRDDDVSPNMDVVNTADCDFEYSIKETDVY